MKQHNDARKRARAEWIYACFLRLYPGIYRRTFGQPMRETFRDHYRDAIETEQRSELLFWRAVICDEAQSIVREQFSALRERGQQMKQWTPATTLRVLLLGVLLGVLLAVLFAYMIGYLTMAYPAGDWSMLLVPVLILAGLLLFVKGASHRVAKLITLAIALGIILSRGLLAALIGDWYDLMVPILLLLSLFFFITLLSEREVLHAGSEKTGWIRAELVYGTLLGLALTVGTAFSVSTSPGSNPPSIANSIFLLAPPLLCGMAGLMSSQKNGTLQAGFYAGALTAVVGLLICVLCNPLLIALFWPTIRSFYHVPPTQSMWNSPGIWGDQLDGTPSVLRVFLFPGICAGAIGSGLGWGLTTRKESPTRG